MILNNHKLHMQKEGTTMRYELYNIVDDPSEDENLIDNPLVNSETMQTITRGLLYYIAQGQPGLNMIIFEKVKRIDYRIKISGIDIINDYDYDKRSRYTVDSSLLNVYINKKELSIGHFPAIVSIEGKKPDGMIRIEYIANPSDKDMDSRQVRMQVGLIGNIQSPSPVHIPRISEAYRKLTFMEGFRRFIENRNDAIVWYTSYGWEWSMSAQNGTTAEEIEEELRNLGYIQ